MRMCHLGLTIACNFVCLLKCWNSVWQQGKKKLCRDSSVCSLSGVCLNLKEGNSSIRFGKVW